MLLTWFRFIMFYLIFKNSHQISIGRPLNSESGFLHLKSYDLKYQIPKITSLNSPAYIRKLSHNNYKLVPYFSKPYLKKYKLNNDEKNELMQEGYIGLMLACQKFNESKGFKLSTYSRFWIMKYMNDYIIKKNKFKTVELHEDRLISIPSVSVVDLDILNNEEKDIVFKRYYQKMKVKDIANLYHLNRATISNKCKKALLKIKNYINS